MQPQVFQYFCRHAPCVLIGFADLAMQAEVLRLSTLLQHPAQNQYWGISSHGVRYRGHSLVHCYNFGSAIVDFPWDAQFVNYGKTLKARVIRAGTYSRAQCAGGPGLLGRTASPYLVMHYHTNPYVTEHLEEGMLLMSGDAEPVQRRNFDVVFPLDFAPSAGAMQMHYNLLHPIAASATPAPHWLPGGSVAGYPALHLELQKPVIAEAGWPVLLQRGDEYYWGVVAA